MKVSRKTRTVKFSEDDVLAALYEALQARGFTPGDRSNFRIRLPKVDKAGRRRRSKVTISVEIAEFPDQNPFYRAGQGPPLDEADMERILSEKPLCFH